ncbi:MAG: FtsX-like permease family protein, partial [Acidobacteriia bacterium]|nr:FtsX-like permease family protein [Terriglobia bacterium]
KSGGLNSAFGGNLAIMDIYAAQHVFGRGRKFDRIDLAVNDGVRVADAQERIRQALGPGFEVEPPASRAQNLESMSRVYSYMLKFSSAFALVIGTFIIYNAFAIAVTQRRSEIGILRALGATRRQIAVLFLSEGAVAGLIGSIVGIAFGSMLAETITSSMSRLLEGIYGIARTPAKAVLSPALMVLALLLGIATSVIAALLPARSAARVDPVKALQKGRLQVLSAGESRMRFAAALVLAACSFALLVFSHSLRVFYAAYASIMLGALLLAPQLSLGLAHAIRPLLKWVRPVEGALAADSLIGAPRRTSATVAALMFSLAMVIGLAGSARSAYVNIAEWINVYLDSDLFVTSSPTLVTRDYKFPPSMAAELQNIAGIEEVQTVRSFRVRYRKGLILVIARELSKAAQRGRVFVVQGDPAKAASETAAGKGVIISETLSSLQKLHIGDPMELPTPRGLLTLPVLGIAREYSDQQGSVILDRAVFKQWWKDDSVDLFRVYLARNADPAQVKETILAHFSGNRRIFVLSNDQVRQYVLRLTKQWFSMTWIQIAVAILVAVLGIVNSLTVSITDRRRELGVLQAVGALRNQVRGTIWMEAVGIGLISVVLGLALGAIQLYYVLQIAYRDYPGMNLSYLYPGAIALLLFPVILAVCFASALVPAESAVHGSLVEALEYE